MFPHRNGKYLNKFKYSNAQTEDLWEELGKAAKKPVAQVMAGWTSQIGYPVISVDIVERKDTEITLKLTQSKFSASNNQTNELTI